jgi:hypothetical protein
MSTETDHTSTTEAEPGTNWTMYQAPEQDDGIEPQAEHDEEGEELDPQTEQAEHDDGLDPQAAQDEEGEELDPQAEQAEHDELPDPELDQSEPAATVAEQDNLMEPESEQAAVAAPTAPHAGGDALLTAEAESDMRSRWTAIQVSFVEDPRTSVEDADALVQEIATAFMASFRERTGELAAAWQHGEPDTEQLRLALRQYRSFIGVVLPV